jgi:septal ring factor EnvC (AmiA/AmiB activator)
VIFALILLAVILAALAGWNYQGRRDAETEAKAIAARLTATEERHAAEDEAQQQDLDDRDGRLAHQKQHVDALRGERSDLVRELNYHARRVADLTAQRGQLVVQRNAEQAKNALLRDAFEGLARFADGEVLELLEHARFLGILPADLFLPSPQTGDES